jgi:large subunit ribosomal protein L21e
MVTGSKGMRSGTRRKLKKGLRDKFKPENLIQRFKAGDKVIISINPSSMRGIPHTRFKGKMGTVMGMKGSAFIVNAYIGKKKKEIYVSPEHLKKA